MVSLKILSNNFTIQNWAFILLCTDLSHPFWLFHFVILKCLLVSPTLKVYITKIIRAFLAWIRDMIKLSQSLRSSNIVFYIWEAKAILVSKLLRTLRMDNHQSDFALCSHLNSTILPYLLGLLMVSAFNIITEDTRSHFIYCLK